MMRKWKGSYTVEAAVIVPIMLWTMAAAMCMGITLLKDVQAQNEHKCVETMWEVEDFYKFQAVEEVVK